ncbi:hypothetical protein ACS0TY_008882 [Phlomoides rotata]
MPLSLDIWWCWHCLPATGTHIFILYIKEATDLAKEQENLKKTADALHQEEMSGSKGRKWRKNVKAVEKEMLLMEEDVKTLEEMYAQGEKAETACSWLPCQIGTWRQWIAKEVPQNNVKMHGDFMKRRSANDSKH